MINLPRFGRKLYCWSRKRYFTKEVQQTVVRYAPSPTGDLHLGGLRTALLNVLKAKQDNGTFFIRIENTDAKRTIPGSAKSIIKILKLFNITSDTEIIYQSNRLAIYREKALELVKQKKAYKCFCEVKEKALKEIFRCNKCKSLTPEELNKNERTKIPYVIRQRFPENEESVTVKDSLRGNVIFLLETLDEHILIKSDGRPTYHLASVVDDIEAKVTNVIRGLEWLTSAPKHVLLYKDFGYFDDNIPIFTHVSLLLDTTGQKLSKRTGSFSTETLLQEGYLPMAILNYIALLGWNPPNNNYIYTDLQSLANDYNIEKISPSGSQVDIKKLNEINAKHIQYNIQQKDTDFLALVYRKLKENGYKPKKEEYSWIILDILKNRCITLNDFVKFGSHFFIVNAEFKYKEFSEGELSVIQTARTIFKEANWESEEELFEATKALS